MIWLAVALGLLGYGLLLRFVWNLAHIAGCEQGFQHGYNVAASYHLAQLETKLDIAKSDGRCELLKELIDEQAKRILVIASTHREAIH